MMKTKDRRFIHTSTDYFGYNFFFLFFSLDDLRVSLSAFVQFDLRASDVLCPRSRLLLLLFTHQRAHECALYSRMSALLFPFCMAIFFTVLFLAFTTSWWRRRWAKAWLSIPFGFHRLAALHA